MAVRVVFLLFNVVHRVSLVCTVLTTAQQCYQGGPIQNSKNYCLPLLPLHRLAKAAQAAAPAAMETFANVATFSATFAIASDA